MLHYRNQLAVFASHLDQSRRLFPKDAAAGSAQQSHTMTSDIVDELKNLVAEAPSGSGHSIDEIPASTMSAGVAMALCHIHRVVESQPEIESRLLILQVAEDEPA